jgi:hypothetical protein
MTDKHTNSRPQSTSKRTTDASGGPSARFGDVGAACAEPSNRRAYSESRAEPSKTAGQIEPRVREPSKTATAARGWARRHGRAVEDGDTPKVQRCVVVFDDSHVSATLPRAAVARFARSLARGFIYIAVFDGSPAWGFIHTAVFDGSSFSRYVYSLRSAMTGSTRVARRAGIQQASSATTNSDTPTTPNVMGSVASTP